jgi:carboxyl-terminal processing protease
MKNLIFILLAAGLLSSCSAIFLEEVPANTRLNTFNYFVEQVEQNYSGKDVRVVAWDSLLRIYRPKITNQSTDFQLIEVMKAMIAPFEDQHLSFNTPNRFYNPATDKFFPKPDSFPNYINTTAVELRLKIRLKNYKNIFSYGKTLDNKGYINVKTFDYFNYNQADYEYFFTILEELKDTKGLVIDVRQNSGGNEYFAKIMAERLTATTQIYKYNRIKIGPNKNDYGDFLTSTIAPQGSWQYTKPIVVLTSKYTYSTGINFVLMLSTQAHVTTLGTPTGNGVVGGISREMPNGWRLQVPSGLAYLPQDKSVIEGSSGVRPEVLAMISTEDWRNNNDTVLEKALNLLP